MNRREFIKTSMAGAALAALPRWARGGEPLPAGAAKRPPNVIMIFVDDLGYADVGAFGCRDIPTPNIDALAREGVRFTNAYCTGAWCVPSRVREVVNRLVAPTGREQSLCRQNGCVGCRP